jgi:hypothetical protein
MNIGTSGLQFVAVEQFSLFVGERSSASFPVAQANSSVLDGRLAGCAPFARGQMESGLKWRQTECRASKRRRMNSRQAHQPWARRIPVKMIIEARLVDDVTECPRVHLATIERELTTDTLGLSLAEGKAIL